uniref:Lysine-specific demethylase 8-like n=1 Tax=Saccoglossus kowalevskii TaxID=10224 RepID=A0ABM0M5Z3_SACKO|nr:PREDICTED: lysine-specific demethylase 8-like [Saccoglossus kowalevskii]
MKYQTPKTFFEQYVKPGKPVLFRGAGKAMKSYLLWTDEYLRKKYGKLEAEVEEGKKENRSKELYHMSFSSFLDVYSKSDVYMVQSMHNEMKDEYMLLKCMLCGGFQKVLLDAVIWFSSGGTKSVLHFDALDNINCLMDGEKELIMVDRKESEHIDIDHPEGSFCGVDVDKVNMTKYPGLKNVPWYTATMKPSDCLFIPYKWFHQVSSSGRNLAVNIWFAHLWSFNEHDCKEDLPDMMSLSEFEFGNSNHQFRGEIYDHFDLLGMSSITEEVLLEYVKDEGGNTEEALNAFQMLDKDKDKTVTFDELLNFPVEDFALLFPSLAQDRSSGPREDLMENDNDNDHDEL